MLYEELSSGLTMTCPALLMRNTTDDPKWTSFIYHDHVSWFPGAGYVVEKLFREHYAERYLGSATGAFHDVSDRQRLFDKISTPDSWKNGSQGRLTPSPRRVPMAVASLSRRSIIGRNGMSYSCGFRASLSPEKALATLHTVKARLADSASLEHPDAISPVSRPFAYAKDFSVDLEPRCDCTRDPVRMIGSTDSLAFLRRRQEKVIPIASLGLCKERDLMADDANRVVLTRREALFLSATAGLGLAAGQTALASDSTKTASTRSRATAPRRVPPSPRPSTARCAASWMAASSPSRAFPTARPRRREPLAARPSRPSPGRTSFPPWSTARTARKTCTPGLALEQTFIQDWDDGWQSEDMLKLNIWTPSLTGKRPVMFYIHGGGFTFGSSYELPSHEGAQMARHHDVVQVSVNHRLNILGFLDVSEIGGSAYEDSVNVGMTDLVAALQLGP